MELHDFVAHVEANLDPVSEESIRAISPAMAALGENRTFLARFIAENLTSPDFQQDNFYSGSALVLARRPSFVVRVVSWPPRPAIPRTALGQQLHVYAEDGEADPIAHTHPFALLTYGYLGSGYETDVYPCDFEELQRCNVGDSVTLGPVEHLRLAGGTGYFYPAGRVAHVQHPSEEFSISLNLIVLPPNAQSATQYFISTRRRVVTGIAESQTGLTLATLALASQLPSETARPLFEQIALSHASPVIRERASAIVADMTHRVAGIAQQTV